MVTTYLRWLCVAFFLVASLKAFSAHPVNGTFYYDVIDVKGATIANATNGSLSIASDGKGLQGYTKMELFVKNRPNKPPPSGFTEAYNGGYKFKTELKPSWKSTSVRNAAKSGLKKAISVGKIAKSSIYTYVAALGLEYAIKKAGWFEEDGELLYYPPNTDLYEFSAFEGFYFYSATDRKLNPDNFKKFATDAEACLYDLQLKRIEPPGYPLKPMHNYKIGTSLGGWCIWTTNGKNRIYKGGMGAKLGNSCPATYTFLEEFGACGRKKEDAPEPRRVTPEMIDELNLDDYTPPDTAIEELMPHLGKPDEIEVIEQPDPIILPKQTTTRKKEDGTTEVTESESKIDIEVKVDNQNNLYITTTETTTNKTYVNGKKTSETTEIKTTDPKEATKPEPQAEPQPQSDPPIDCELVPTLCDTQRTIIANDKEFRDWMKQPPAEPPKIIIPKKSIEDFRERFDIKVGNAICPAPMPLNTYIAGIIYVSFDPICEFARILKFLVVGGASIFAAYILMGVARKGG